jgi:K+-sensing histidine kinase KdpD
MPSGQYVVVSVHDTGAGMSSEVQRHAFEPFFTTKGPASGTGLGLAQVYGFVSQSGGHIRLSSKIGQGTSVSMYLPAISEVETAKEPTSPVTSSNVARSSILSATTYHQDNGPVGGEVAA